MSWLARCYETYENCLSEVGDQKGVPVPLLPISHTTQQVNIEVSLTLAGDFLSARLLLNKEDRTTIIPCTEKSSARTSGTVPHPLVDKLQYIAADYAAFGGRKEFAWPAYVEQLRGWCTSPFAHPLVCSVLHYLEKGRLIADLVTAHILFTDADGKLPSAWTGGKEQKPLILNTMTGTDQTESFVRFVVDGTDLSREESVWDSFSRYYESLLQRRDFCTVQGIETLVSDLSPYKIRNPGDRAKLISSNDSTNFTYRGRFITTEQALSVGYETSQKAHSALRWLISRQSFGGVRNCCTGDQTILVWDTSGNRMPQVIYDTKDIGDDFLSKFSDSSPSADTAEGIAKNFKNAMLGYKKMQPADSSTVVMILDSATPGRLSIRYYRELNGSRLLENIEDWHEHFSWQLEYRTIPDPNTPLGKKPKPKRIVFYGAPAPIDIAKAAYGEGVDTKLIQQTQERLVPCISERKLFPRDLMLNAVSRATAGVGLEPWEYRKTLSIACALVRGYYHRNKKEDFSMGVNENNNDRSYLFGRILACAEQIERRAQADSGSTNDKRATNAERLRVAFVQHPAKTTVILQEKLDPYINRLRTNSNHLSRYDLMLELLDRIDEKEFTNKPLSELYLLGYANQMMDFRRENAANNASATAQ